MRTPSITSFDWSGVILGVIFALTSATAMARSAPNPKKLVPITFHLSGRQFVFPVPRDGLSKDVPRFKPVLDVDLDGLPAKEKKWVLLLKEMWDWPAGFLFNIHGSLRIYVVAYAAPDGVEANCESDLRRMINAQVEGEMKHFKEVGGQERFRPQITLLPNSIPLSGGRALVYVDKGFNDDENYVIPVTSRSYLVVRFIFYDESYPKKNPDWRRSAAQMKEAILAGMRFDGDWSPLRECPR